MDRLGFSGDEVWGLFVGLDRARLVGGEAGQAWDAGGDRHGRSSARKDVPQRGNIAIRSQASALRTAEGVAGAACHAPRRTDGTLAETTKPCRASLQAGPGCQWLARNLKADC